MSVYLIVTWTRYEQLRMASINTTGGGVTLQPLQLLSAASAPDTHPGTTTTTREGAEGAWAASGGGPGVAPMLLGGGDEERDRALDFEIEVGVIGGGGGGSSFVLALGAQCEGSLGSRGKTGSGAGLVGDAIGCRDGVVFLINVSTGVSSNGVSDGHRESGDEGSGGGSNAEASLTMLLGGVTTHSPPVTILPGETTLPVRLMTDVGTVEIFLAGGRAVASTAVYSNSTQVVAAALKPGGVAHLAAVAGWRLVSLASSYA